MTTINKDEIQKFSELADEWWDVKGKFKPLHMFNPIRIEYILDEISKYFKIDRKTKLFLKDLKILDIGCGGGLISEPMARLGASFSGSLAKLEKNRSTIPSTRGSRYFGPSKMSFYNLIKHSLSIIAVFKTNVIIRSVIFYLIYFFLISEKLTYITSIPLILIVIFAISVLAISKRENLDNLNKSLLNISHIDNLK